MFFQYTDQLTQVDLNELNADLLTVGYVTCDELAAVYPHFGFAESTAAACRETNTHFRSGVETYDDYTFTELRVIGATPENDDWVALYIKKNLILVVDVWDADGSTKGKFFAALNRYNPDNVTLEKVIFSFFDQLLAGDIQVIEDISEHLSEMEDELLGNVAEVEFNSGLLDTKKQLLRLHYYYEQILDMTQSMEENENDLFASDKLMYLSNMTRRVERLREDVDSLKNTVEHLQDAYFSYLDMKMNQTMKLLTVITTIFFPLTIIVGWYGMNFTTMPELTWKYGYLYVIVLSVFVVIALAIISKIRKWFR
ncbi:MAG: hypothetical protein MJ073_00410 [Oscillibacter sp.]|nr:hypothetical protein [Oscillibacter sp.]